MGNSRERPRACLKPPDINSTKEILVELLDIERKRLKVAVRIEKERDIVFPETTIIIRDIQKIQTALNKFENNNDDDDDNVPIKNFIFD